MVKIKKILTCAQKKLW